MWIDVSRLRQFLPPLWGRIQVTPILTFPHQGGRNAWQIAIAVPRTAVIKVFWRDASIATEPCNGGRSATQPMKGRMASAR
jgi:hypothetical protein